MSNGWSMFVAVVTLLSMAAVAWLLISNRSKEGKGEELDHEFDGIREYDNPLPAWWVGMFGLSVVFGLGYVFYYPALGNMSGASGWSSQKEWLHASEQHTDRFAALYANYAAMAPEELVKDRRAMQTGRRLFLNYCSTCHGVAAKGGEGFPNLTDSEWIWGADFGAIKHTILNGRVAAMPAWEQVLQPEQLIAVSSYVKEWSTSGSAPTGNEVGANAFATYCVACHGVNAQGNPALGAPSLNDESFLYGGSIEDITYSIAKGRAGNMPAQGDIVGVDKTHLLAAYVYSLRNTQAGSMPGQPAEKTAGGD
jgi:cytochrome c oxidase cbb3-type subunit 3